MGKFKPCPIDLDCQAMTGIQGAKCPNRESCNHWARPEELQYRGEWHKWGYLIRVLNNKQPGWDRAEPLQYEIVNLDGIRCLLVTRTLFWDMQAWGIAEDLPVAYLLWAAGKVGKTLEEAEFLHQWYYNDRWTSKHFRDYYPDAIERS